jgi:hypothetical protein
VYLWVGWRVYLWVGWRVWRVGQLESQGPKGSSGSRERREGTGEVDVDVCL